MAPARFATLMLTLLCLGVTVSLSEQLSRRTALDDYVAKPDPEYNFTVVNEYNEGEASIYILNMTSQKWLNESVSSRPVWWHYLSVVVPRKLNPTFKKHAILRIGDGSNGDEQRPPDPSINPIFDYLIDYAVSLGTVSAFLQQVPNQPITFPDDPEMMERTEDDIIAFTWRRFQQELNCSEPEALLLFPMVKSATRAMDTIQTFINATRGYEIDKFMLNGDSKRGWATWLAGAVDPRVYAIAPEVFTLLNVVKNFHRHFQALGGWSFGLTPYYDQNLTRFIDTPQAAISATHLDPFAYKDRLTMPKLITSASGDEIFLNQDSHIWLDQLPGPTYFRMLENADHSLANIYDDLFENLKALSKAVIKNATMPSLKWERSQTLTGGTIRLTTDTEPLHIEVWYSRTDKRTYKRDWRRHIFDEKDLIKNANVVWKYDKVMMLDFGVYEASYEFTKSKYIAFFIKAEFAGSGEETFTFTSEVNIAPDFFPFDDCSGEECYGDPFN